MIPIQTTYKGYRFRSRLEARWAVFFDALGVVWEYEPEGYVLKNGKHYLPDFKVTFPGGVVTWFEIKGDKVEDKTFSEFMEGRPVGERGAVLNGIPSPHDIEGTGGYGWGEPDAPFCLSGGGGWDNNYRFCICMKCGRAGFEFDGRSYRIGCLCKPPEGVHPDKGYTPGHFSIQKAAAKARAARFEHDEREVWQ